MNHYQPKFGKPAVWALCLLAAFVIAGMATGRLLTRWQKPKYGYFGLLEIPQMRDQLLLRASAVRSYLQVYARTVTVPGGAFRTIVADNDASPFVEITTYGDSLDTAREVLEKALVAVSTGLGEPLAQHRRERDSILRGFGTQKLAIEEELAALTAKKKGRSESLPSTHEEIFLRWRLANLDEQEATFRKTMLEKHTGEFRFAQLMPISDAPILPNAGRWGVFGAVIGFGVGLLLLALLQNFRLRRRVPAAQPA